MLTFLITFTLLTLLSSFFIVEFFQLSRHWIIVEPDNRQTVEGDLLKWWSVFWEEVKEVKKVYYSGNSLEFKHMELLRLRPKVGGKLIPNTEGFSLKILSPLTDSDLSEIRAVITCRTEIKEDICFLYIERPVFLFPEWVRKPMSACYVCMSSTFGSIIWWTYIKISSNQFYWCRYPKLGYFLFWIAFLVILSLFNRVIGKKSYEYV